MFGAGWLGGKPWDEDSADGPTAEEGIDQVFFKNGGRSFGVCNGASKGSRVAMYTSTHRP